MLSTLYTLMVVDGAESGVDKVVRRCRWCNRCTIGQQLTNRARISCYTLSLSLPITRSFYPYPPCPAT